MSRTLTQKKKMGTSITEIWKETEYNGVFVSNIGRVRRADGFIYSTPVCLGNGYRYIYLSFSNKTKGVKVARLVAKAFVPNPDCKPYVDHINTMRTDDRADNLRWVTMSENMRNPKTVEKCKASRPKIQPWRRKPLLQYSKDGEFIREWDSATSFGKSINKNVSANISACIRGRQPTAYGYIWKLKQ